MSENAKNGDVEGDLVEALDEISCDEQGLWHVLIAGNWSGGYQDEAGAFIMSRCLLEVVTGSAFDAAGHFCPVPHAGWDKSTATAKRVRNRVRRALRAARQAGAQFVLCYHIEGDPRWYMEWSEHHDKGSAVEEVKQYLQDRMVWEPVS